MKNKTTSGDALLDVFAFFLNVHLLGFSISLDVYPLPGLVKV